MTRMIVVASHGDFAKGLIQSSELIIGPSEDVYGIGFYHGDSVETLKANIEQYLIKAKNETKEVLVLVDLFGGSPCNVALGLLKDYDHDVITGVNMGMLIEAISMTDMSRVDIVEHLENVAKESIRVYNKKAFERRE